MIPEIDILSDLPDASLLTFDDLVGLSRFAIANELGASDLRVVSILLTTDQRMRTLHRNFMGLDSPTDIMTFPTELEPGVDGRGGDIVISVDAARENALDVGHSTEDEIRFLVVHGILHLAGWDDHDDVDRARMLARQAEVIEAFARRD